MMKQWMLIACICLSLLVGLKDGRVIVVDGFPLITFDGQLHDGRVVPCLLIIIDGKAYPVPIEMIDGLKFVPDELVM